MQAESETIPSYLVIDFPEGWGHLVGECASHNDHIGLSRGCTEHDAVSEKNQHAVLGILNFRRPL